MSINAQSAADLYAKRDGREPDLLFRMRARADHRQVCRCRRCVERWRESELRDTWRLMRLNTSARHQLGVRSQYTMKPRATRYPGPSPAEALPAGVGG
jgi:hypothetical protein